MTLTPEQLKALQWIKTATRGRFDIGYSLAGDRNKAHRQTLMTQLTGTKTTQAQSGVTALQRVAWALAGDAIPANQCIAAQNEAFTEWATAATDTGRR